MTTADKLEAESHVLIDTYTAITGMTRKAIEYKISSGRWVVGRQYHKDPDGRIWIDRQGVIRWVVQGRG